MRESERERTNVVTLHILLISISIFNTAAAAAATAEPTKTRVGAHLASCGVPTRFLPSRPQQNLLPFRCFSPSLFPLFLQIRLSRVSRSSHNGSALRRSSFSSVARANGISRGYAPPPPARSARVIRANTPSLSLSLSVSVPVSLAASPES